jgi:transposase
MPRRAPDLACPPDTRAELTAISMSRTTEARLVERAHIILDCLEGKQIKQVAEERNVSVPTVSKWRQRFAFFGLLGLSDAFRPGKPPIYGREYRNRVLALLEQPPPVGQACWDGPALAANLGGSVDAVWRVLRNEGIHLQRKRTWCVSTDPQFASKAADVVKLYLDPPENAVVICVDEKPSIQAIERPSGYVQADNGKIMVGVKSTYKRHGTLNLFSALDVANGQVYAQTTDFKKREDFRGFMDAVIKELPAGREIHVILDNYATHKRNDDWLAQYGGRVQFHFTPTSASWLNQVEIFFSLLARKALRGASFKSKAELKQAIEAFIAAHNQRARPFRWRKRDVRGSQLRNTLMNLCA